MPSKAKNLHFLLFESYKRCYPNYSGMRAQDEVNDIWTAAKEKYSEDKPGLNAFIEDKIKNLQILTTKKNRR